MTTKKVTIPEHMTSEEAAEFFDTHDATEIEGLEDVEDVELPPMSTFALRLDAKTLAGLRDAAQAAGERPTALARRWLEERLDAEQTPLPDRAATERVLSKLLVLIRHGGLSA